MRALYESIHPTTALVLFELDTTSYKHLVHSLRGFKCYIILASSRLRFHPSYELRLCYGSMAVGPVTTWAAVASIMTARTTLRTWPTVLTTGATVASALGSAVMLAVTVRAALQGLFEGEREGLVDDMA